MTIAEWQYWIEGQGIKLRRLNPVICCYREHHYVKRHWRIWKWFSHTLLTSTVILCWSLLLRKDDKIKHETQKATI